MGDPVKPVLGYIKGNRYHVAFERGADGGAQVVRLEVLGLVYTPAGTGFRGPDGHETTRGLAVVKAQGDARFSVVWPESGEPITATSKGMDFLSACEFAAKQAAASVLRDKEKRDREAAGV